MAPLDQEKGPGLSQIVGGQIKERAVGTAVDWLIKILLPTAVISGAIGGITGGLVGHSVAKQEAAAQIAALKQAAAAPGGSTVDSAAVGLAQLEVTSVPEAARVRIDNRLVGKTPLDRLEVEAGKHAVVIELHGHEPFVGDVEVKAGRSATVHAVLEEKKDEPVAAAAKAPRRAAAPRGPTRDCTSEQNSCDNRCRDAVSSCEGSCQTCYSCTNTQGWDSCNAQCSTCKEGCKQGRGFCESQCDSQYDSCRAQTQ